MHHDYLIAETFARERNLTVSRNNKKEMLSSGNFPCATSIKNVVSCSMQLFDFNVGAAFRTASSNVAYGSLGTDLNSWSRSE